MTETVTCTYDSVDKVHNAKEDLVASGIPQEKIFVVKEDNQIKVMIPAASRPEIEEILNRHNPSKIE
jgi:hypothetical protein